MPLKKVTDQSKIAELQDQLDARDAGISDAEFEKIKKSKDYKHFLEASHNYSGFSGARPDEQGGYGSSIFRGVIGLPAEGVAQFLAHAGHDIQKKVGLDPNKGMFGGRGYFADENVAYADAQPKISAMREQRAREQRGRHGTDVAETVASFFSPGLPGGPVTKGLGKVALHAATEGGVTAGMQPVYDTEDGYWSGKAKQAGIGSAVGGTVGSGIYGLGRAGSAFGKRAADIAENVDIGKRQGMDLSIAEASPSRAVRQASDIAGNTFVGGSIPAQAQKNLDKFAERVDQTADTIAGGRHMGRSQAVVGDVAQTGLEGHVKRFTDEADNMYKAVDAHVPADTRVQLGETYKALRSTVDAFDSAPELGVELANKRLQRMAKALTIFDEAGQPIDIRNLSFKEAQRFRSEIGKMMGQSELLSDIPRAELKNVYKNLTAEMRKSIEPNDTALKAFDDASAFYKAGHDHIDETVAPMLKRKSGERMVDAMQSMISNDYKRIGALRKSMLPEEWNQVAGYMFRNLGQPRSRDAANQGFSAIKFLDDYNALRQNKEAFNAAFGGTEYSKLTSTYDDLAKLADNIKRAGDIANKSRSGYTAANTTLMAALFGAGGIGGIPLAAKTAGGFWLTAKALSSPRIAETVAKMGRTYMRNQARPRWLNRYLRRNIAKLSAIQAGQQEAPQAPEE